MNGVAQVPYPVSNIYSRTTLERALPLLIHDKWAQIKDIPKNNTNIIKFRKFGALAASVTALTEGVTPAGKTLSVTDVTTTVLQYGDFVLGSDWVDFTSPDAVLVETAEVLGEQAGLSLDTLLATVMNAGTNVQYADNSSPKTNAARTDVAIADILAIDELRIAVRTMKRNNVKKITRLVSPDTGYATTPVNACYVGIIHPNTTYALKAITGWTPVELYANKADVMPGEVGKFDEIRFVETTQAKVFTAGGAGGIDVYSTLILGADAYGISRISGEAMHNIVKTLGSAGTTDPLNQRWSSGWKVTFGATILQQLFMLRLEHAV
jgi:N4-gp56 family major capsid protein